MNVSTHSLPFGKLGLTLEGRFAYLTIEGGAFKLFMTEATFSQLIAFLKASRDDRVLTAHHVTVTISSPWHDAHAWTSLPGAIRYASDSPGTDTHAELTPADRDRLITTWESHLEALKPAEAKPAEAPKEASTPPAPPPAAETPPEPAKISLPVITE